MVVRMGRLALQSTDWRRRCLENSNENSGKCQWGLFLGSIDEASLTVKILGFFDDEKNGENYFIGFVGYSYF